VKELIGRSPDFADMLAMRMIFLVKSAGGLKFAGTA
jgi:hypothetical protein